MWYTTEGIIGTPLGVSSTFVFLFILFEALFGQDWYRRVLYRYYPTPWLDGPRGGPAKSLRLYHQPITGYCIEIICCQHSRYRIFYHTYDEAKSYSNGISAAVEATAFYWRPNHATYYGCCGIFNG